MENVCPYTWLALLTASQANERWRPMAISNPSTRLRAARSMPQWVKEIDLQFRVRRLLDVGGGLLFLGPPCTTIESPVFSINVAFFKNVFPDVGNTAVEPQNG
uniref:Uncharacterized protein n=1 Tax=Timema poppense TaxID=170557 RepID=A0A7R9CL25_TIMPO|nr:unnamed protein product [Timema poppensis]